MTNQLDFQFRKHRVRHPVVGGHREAAPRKDLEGGQIRRRWFLVCVRFRRRQDVRRSCGASWQLGGLLRLRRHLLRRIRVLPPLRAKSGAGSDLIGERRQ